MKPSFDGLPAPARDGVAVRMCLEGRPGRRTQARSATERCRLSQGPRSSCHRGRNPDVGRRCRRPTHDTRARKRRRPPTDRTRTGRGPSSGRVLTTTSPAARGPRGRERRSAADLGDEFLATHRPPGHHAPLPVELPGWLVSTGARKPEAGPCSAEYAARRLGTGAAEGVPDLLATLAAAAVPVRALINKRRRENRTVVCAAAIATDACPVRLRRGLLTEPGLRQVR